MDIFLIHGANQTIHEEKEGARILLESWINDIESGFLQHQFDPKLLKRAHFKMLYYTDLQSEYKLFDINHSETTHIPDHLIRDQINEFERHFEAKATAIFESSAEEKGLKEKLFHKLLGLLEGKFEFVDKLFIKTVFREAYCYLENEKYVNDIQNRFRELIGESNDFLIIAHSLGTLVSYDYACFENSKKINKIVTMGSPLAINFFKNLRRNPLIIPSSIKEGWINLYNKEDYISVYPLKAPKYMITPNIENIIVETIDNAPHHIEGYLKSKEFCQFLYNELKNLKSNTKSFK